MSNPERVKTRQPSLVVLAGGMAKRYGGCKPLAPVGPRGEAIIDLTAGDALRGGFGKLVLVLGPVTGPAIAYHVERCWPASVEVAFAEQPVPLGTAHALACARPHLDEGSAFAVVNADDIYGERSFSLLASHLSAGEGPALVAFRLRNTVVSDAPVTRGTCVPHADGTLARIDERRNVTRSSDGHFRADDGKEPTDLEPDTLVSVNLWGFEPEIWKEIDAALEEHQSMAGSPDAPREVLLPEVVSAMVSRGQGGSDFALIRSEERCIGVTHPGDLAVVRAEVASMVARGARPENPWSSTA